MHIHRRHSKYYWPTGLISLLMLPLLLGVTVLQNDRVVPKYSMDLNLPSDQFWKWMKDNSWENFDNLPKEDWISFYLTDDHARNELILHDIQHEVRRFNTDHDTSRGIRIRLDRGASYGVFVRLLDMLDLENITRRAVAGHDVFILKHSPRPQDVGLVPLKFGPIDFGPIILPERTSERSATQRFKAMLTQYAFLSEARVSWILGVIILGLILVQIADLRKVRDVHRSRWHRNQRNIHYGSTK